MPSDRQRVPDTPEFWSELEEELWSAAEGRRRRRFRRISARWESLVGLLTRPARVVLRQGLGHAIASLAVVTAALIPIISQSNQVAQIGGAGEVPTAFSVWALSGSSDRFLGEPQQVTNGPVSVEPDHHTVVPEADGEASGDPIDDAWREPGSRIRGEVDSPFPSAPPLTDGSSTAV